MNNTTVIGVFDSAEEAQKAVSELQAAGFATDSVDHAQRGAQNVNASAPGGADAYQNTSGTMVEGAADAVDRGVSKAGNAVANAAHNAANSPAGGADAYQNTSGTLVEGAADAADRGVSSIGRFFSNLFSDDHQEADRYTHVASQSNSIVTVHADSHERAEQAAEILDRCGAVDVNERSEQVGYNTTANQTATVSNDRTAETGQTLKVVEENLRVGKREVETGGARLRSRIVSRPVEESLRLREEHVFVNRTPVDRAATEADFSTFREGTIELRETAEVPVVSKEARVVEEVSLGKEVNERQETVRETVRKTEVDVEQIPGKESINRDANKRDI